MVGWPDNALRPLFRGFVLARVTTRAHLSWVASQAKPELMIVTLCSPVCAHCGAAFRRRRRTAIYCSTISREKGNIFRAAERRRNKRPKQTRPPSREG